MCALCRALSVLVSVPNNPRLSPDYINPILGVVERAVGEVLGHRASAPPRFTPVVALRCPPAVAGVTRGELAVAAAAPPAALLWLSVVLNWEELRPRVRRWSLLIQRGSSGNYAVPEAPPVAPAAAPAAALPLFLRFFALALAFARPPHES